MNMVDMSFENTVQKRDIAFETDVFSEKIQKQSNSA